MNLRADIIAHERERRKSEDAQKTELKRRILSLPNNPRLKPFGGGFVVSFANLGNNWSAEHHNFTNQYRMLAELVSRAESPFSALMRVRRALQERRVVVGNTAIALHPDVIRGVRKVFA